MTMRDWQRGDSHVLGVFLNGRELLDTSPEGRRLVDDSFLCLFNAGHDDTAFTLPAQRFGTRWRLELCTFEPDRAPGSASFDARGRVEVPSLSLKLLRSA
jgi:isoamylase